MSEVAGASDPKCWSFARGGQRCDLIAGHMAPHQHVVSIEWTDEEAWTPNVVATAGHLGVSVEVPVLGYPDLPTVEQDVPVLDTGACFNCDHPVHHDPCEVRIGPAECGCTFKGV